MRQKVDLIDRIDEVRANSVTPEQFKKRWGYSLEDHGKRMMDFIHKLEAEEAPAEEVVMDAAEKEVLRPAALPAAAAKASGKKTAKKEERVFVHSIDTECEHLERETLNELVKKIQTLLSQMKAGSGAGKVVTLTGGKAGKKRAGAGAWDLKLVAVKTGTGKTLAAGAPVIIADMDSPSEEIIVAQVYSPSKKGVKGLTVDKTGMIEFKGMEGVTLAESVKGVMVDVGGLKIADVAGPNGRKGGPKM